MKYEEKTEVTLKLEPKEWNAILELVYHFRHSDAQADEKHDYYLSGFPNFTEPWEFADYLHKRIPSNAGIIDGER